jgi:hypothetical protein
VNYIIKNNKNGLNGAFIHIPLQFSSESSSVQQGLHHALLANFQRQLLAQAFFPSINGEQREQQQPQRSQYTTDQQEEPMTKRAKLMGPASMANNNHNGRLRKEQRPEEDGIIRGEHPILQSMNMGNGQHLEYLNEMLVAKGFCLPPGGLAELPSGQLLSNP